MTGWLVTFIPKAAFQLWWKLGLFSLLMYLLIARGHLGQYNIWMNKEQNSIDTHAIMCTFIATQLSTRSMTCCYRPQSKGDNVLSSVRLSVCVCVSILRARLWRVQQRVFVCVSLISMDAVERLSIYYYFLPFRLCLKQTAFKHNNFNQKSVEINVCTVSSCQRKLMNLRESTVKIAQPTLFRIVNQYQMDCQSYCSDNYTDVCWRATHLEQFCNYMYNYYI